MRLGGSGEGCGEISLSNQPLKSRSMRDLVAESRLRRWSFGFPVRIEFIERKSREFAYVTSNRAPTSREWTEYIP